MPKFQVLWEAPEFEYREKDISWYWLSIIIAALIVAFAAWQKDFLFGFFVVIAEILFIVWGNRVPHTAEFTLTDTDLEIAGYRSHTLNEFEGWSATGLSDGWSQVSFYFRARLRTPLDVLVPEDKLAEVRANLKTVLREVEHEPTLIDSIEKFLRF